MRRSARNPARIQAWREQDHYHSGRDAPLRSRSGLRAPRWRGPPMSAGASAAGDLSSHPTGTITIRVTSGSIRVESRDRD